MKTNFDVVILEEARAFIKKQSPETQKKVVFVIQKARRVVDNRTFKKLDSEIWEFRMQFKSKQIRLLSFWDLELNSLVVCTHGFVKKTQKTPRQELKKAKNIKDKYYKYYKNKSK